MYSIGISVKNEEKLLKPMVDSLIKDLTNSNLNDDSEILICINGSTDNSLEQARKIQRERPRQIIRILESEPGKSHAQKKMIELSMSDKDFIIFYDADITVCTGATIGLISTLEENSSIKASSVDQRVLNEDTLVYKILNFNAIHDSIFEGTRNYIIGRGFAIRKSDYEVPGFMLAEDFYLSCYLNYRYGLGSVQSSEKSIINYVGPRSFKDYFNKIHRYGLDVRALQSKRPELFEISKLLKRPKKEEFLEELDFQERLEFLAHKIIKKIAREYSLLRRDKDWKRLDSTKGI